MNRQTYVIDTIVTTMLDTDAAKDKLIELIWNSWTEEQRKELSAAAFQSARAKIEEVSAARLKSYRGNMFSALLDHEVTRAFRESSAIVAINDLIKIELEGMKGELTEKVRTAMREAAREIISRALRSVDYRDIREAVNSAVADED